MVTKITEALNRVLILPDVQTKMESMGGQVAPGTPAQYAQALRTEIGQVEKMMKAAKLKPQ